MGLHSLLDLFRGQYSCGRASTFFLVTLLAAVVFRHFVIEQDDPYQCRSLMREGHWYQDKQWLTPGCVSGSYGSRSMHDCMQGKKISLIGDDFIQQLYWALRLKIDPETEVRPANHDSHHSSDGLDIEFLWDPYFNRSESIEYVQAFDVGEATKPTIAVIGSPQELAERGDLHEYKARLDSMVKPSNSGLSLANVGFSHFDTKNGPGDLLLFAPLQEPLEGQDSDSSGIHREMNDQLRTQAERYGLDVLWSFDRTTAGRKDKYLDDGITPHPDVVRRRADLLISLRCTAKFSQDRGFQNPRSCCGTWRQRNWVQTSFLVLGLAVLPITVALDYLRPTLREQDRPVVRALSAFTAMISLQYIADRTHIFEQVPRLRLVNSNLYSMLLVALLAGLVTIRRSVPPKKPASGEKQPGQPFLPRDQTDEMKGWMQLAIIIYHYNAAWKADWYWEIIRVCVASYLFLTGFGHAVYFLRKGDYSLKRVMAVMLRTNLLPSTLAYVMRTRWLMYYYMPLSSFWFMVVYATLAIGAQYNRYRTFVIAKIGISAYLVHTFVNTPDLPETVVKLFVLVFRMSFDANEFFDHRVRIDQYIVYMGMLIAMLYLWILETLGSEPPTGRVKRLFRRFFVPIKIATVIATAFILPYFWYWANTSLESKGQWTEHQPYITVIPVLSFLVLRNAHSTTRNWFSFAFAWLGRYSGEMYVMQDHLWLAGDQRAILRTGFFRGDDTVAGDRWRDLVLVTPLYFIACCIIGDSTATITNWFTKEAAPRQLPAPSEAGPASEVEMALLGEKDKEDDEEPVEKSRSWRLVDMLSISLWPGKVRDRTLLLLAFMWFLNLVSQLLLFSNAVYCT